MRSRRFISLAAVGFLSAFLVISPGTSALADTPSEPVGEFYANLCPGETDFDPTADTGSPFADLTHVFGQRLIDYNNGQHVVLYDVLGTNFTPGYPAICSVRYVEDVGPVSEWMFCTDYFSAVCSGTDEDGRLLDDDGTAIPGLDTLDGNPRLDLDMEKLISYLIQNGHEYQGSGYFLHNGVEFGRANGTSDERMALQTLIWCVSDYPVLDDDSTAAEIERLTTCEDSLDAAERQRLLSLIPDTPELTIEFSDPAEPGFVGTAMPVTLTTNVFNQPIHFSVTNSAIVEVISPGVTLTADELVVTGDDPSTAISVELVVTAPELGAVNIHASATPPSREALTWNQSPGSGNPDVKPCQVFATFNSLHLPQVTGDTQLLAQEGPAENPGVEDDDDTDNGESSNESGPDSTPSGIDELPATGSEATGMAIASGGLIVLGWLITGAARRWLLHR